MHAVRARKSSPAVRSGCVGCRSGGAGHLPEEARPDEDPEIPTQHQELDHGHAHQAEPPAGVSRLQFAIRDGRVPAVHVHRQLVAPDERQRHGVHECNQQQFDHHRVAQPEGRVDGCVEQRKRVRAHEAVPGKRAHDRQQALVDQHLGRISRGTATSSRSWVSMSCRNGSATPAPQAWPSATDSINRGTHIRRTITTMRRRTRSSESPESRARRSKLIQRPTGHQGKIIQLVE